MNRSRYRQQAQKERAERIETDSGRTVSANSYVYFSPYSLNTDDRFAKIKENNNGNGTPHNNTTHEQRTYHGK
eukprot:scaffold7752_cov140-Skeletonema_marinoi.AAC.2